MTHNRLQTQCGIYQNLWANPEVLVSQSLTSVCHKAEDAEDSSLWSYAEASPKLVPV